MWSVGGSCDAPSREKFSDFLRVALSGKTDKDPIPESIGKWECPFDDKGLVYDYSYEVFKYYYIQYDLIKLSDIDCLCLLHSLKVKGVGFTGMKPSKMST